MKKQLRKFDFDSWVVVEPHDLKEGDIFAYGDTTALFKGLDLAGANSATQIIAESIQDDPIRIQLGEKGSDWEFIVMAMDFAGSSCHEFGDGSAIISDFADGKTAVYSPRLPLKELNKFCKENLSVYETFYNNHFISIDDGKSIPMERFW